jgi:hypothetical protein
VVVVAGEVSVVVLLGLPATVAVGFGAAAVLLVALSVVVARTVIGAVPVPCRCFGPSRQPLGWPHVVRNVLLLLSAVAGGLAASAPRGPLDPAAATTALSVAALGVVGVLFFDDLLSLLGSPGLMPPSSE